MTQIIEWFGWGNGVGALAAISAILTLLVLLAPVVFGLILYGLERVQVELIGTVNRDFAYFFVNFVTFPGTFVHEMAHLCFGVITGAEVNEICMFEDDGERLGHISYRTRGPWFMEAAQHTSRRWPLRWWALASGIFFCSLSLAVSFLAWPVLGSGTW
jgi:hypothetical protein